MEYWVTWLIIAAIGLVVGLVVHGLFKFAQGSSVLATIVAGILGALLAGLYVTPYVGVAGVSFVVMRYIWALLGAIVLSVIVELLFVGTRRGRVVTS